LEINAIAARIAAAVRQQIAVRRRLSRRVHEAARGTHALSSSIAGVKRAANGTGAAGQVLGAAQPVSPQAEELSGVIDHFIADVQAALDSLSVASSFRWWRLPPSAPTPCGAALALQLGYGWPFPTG
jgi:hypothetical protein